MIDLQNQDGVFVLRMQSGENRLNAKFVAALNAALDEVERSTEPTALVTVGEGKFYSNGLDLGWMAEVGHATARQCVGAVHELLARVLTFPVITVAAINGHAYAAGAMLVLAHDLRIMRSDRGYFCLPEVDIQIPFSVAMATLIQARLPKVTAHEAMVTGRRYTADQARERQIVDAVAGELEVLPTALAQAKSLIGKHRPTLAAIKRTAYREVLEATAAERR